MGEGVWHQEGDRHQEAAVQLGLRVAPAGCGGLGERGAPQRRGACARGPWQLLALQRDAHMMKWMARPLPCGQHALGTVSANQEVGRVAAPKPCGREGGLGQWRSVCSWGVLISVPLQGRGEGSRPANVPRAAMAKLAEGPAWPCRGGAVGTWGRRRSRASVRCRWSRGEAGSWRGIWLSCWMCTRAVGTRAR